MFLGIVSEKAYRRQGRKILLKILRAVRLFFFYRNAIFLLFGNHIQSKSFPYAALDRFGFFR